MTPDLRAGTDEERRAAGGLVSGKQPTRLPAGHLATAAPSGGLGRRSIRVIRVIRAALATRRYRRAAFTATVAYLLMLLLAIRDLTIAPGRDMSRFVDIPSVEVVPSWGSRMFEQLALFQFEPIAAVYPVNHVEILVSPLNVVTGLVLGLLVGLNIAVAWHLVATVRACGTGAFGGLLGALPGFLSGFACCVPTLAVVVGAQFSVFLTAVRSWFVPVAVLALIGALLWNVHRTERALEGAAGLGSAPGGTDQAQAIMSREHRSGGEPPGRISARQH